MENKPAGLGTVKPIYLILICLPTVVVKTWPASHRLLSTVSQASLEEQNQWHEYLWKGHLYLSDSCV